MGALRIDLGALNEGVNRYSFSVGPEEIDLEEEETVYPAPVEIELELTRTGKTLTIRGKIRTRSGKPRARF